MGENQSIQPQRLSDRIPYRLDTEVPPTHPESWRQRVSEETISEDSTRDARVRDRGTKHPSGSHPYGDDYSSQVQCECRCGADQAMDGQRTEEKVSLSG